MATGVEEPTQQEAADDGKQVQAQPDRQADPKPRQPKRNLKKLPIGVDLRTSRGIFRIDKITIDDRDTPSTGAIQVKPDAGIRLWGQGLQLFSSAGFLKTSGQVIPRSVGVKGASMAFAVPVIGDDDSKLWILLRSSIPGVANVVIDRTLQYTTKDDEEEKAAEEKKKKEAQEKKNLAEERQGSHIVGEVLNKTMDVAAAPIRGMAAMFAEDEKKQKEKKETLGSALSNLKSRLEKHAEDEDMQVSDSGFEGSGISDEELDRATLQVGGLSGVEPGSQAAVPVSAHAAARAKIYAEAVQDPVVQGMEREIRQSADAEMRAIAEKNSGISVAEQARYSANIEAVTRRNILGKFSAEFPQKAAAYRTQIRGLAEIMQGGSLGMSAEGFVAAPGGGFGSGMVKTETQGSATVSGQGGVHANAHTATTVQDREKSQPAVSGAVTGSPSVQTAVRGQEQSQVIQQAKGAQQTNGTVTQNPSGSATQTIQGGFGQRQPGTRVGVEQSAALRQAGGPAHDVSPNVQVSGEINAKVSSGIIAGQDAKVPAGGEAPARVEDKIGTGGIVEAKPRQAQEAEIGQPQFVAAPPTAKPQVLDMQKPAAPLAAPLATQGDAQKAQGIPKGISKIPKVLAALGGIEKTPPGSPVSVKNIPNAEAQAYAPILARLKNADLRGQSPLSKADKGLRLAREISALAGRQDVADTVGKVHEGFAQVRPDVEDALADLPGEKTEVAKNLNPDQKFAQNAARIQKVLKVTEKVAHMTGQEGIAALAGELGGDIAQGAKKGGGAGTNFIGNKIGKKFVGKDLSKLTGGKLGAISKSGGAAMGGAAAGIMQGEGALGITQNALSWYVLDIAFGSLLTPWSPVALVYLNFHYIASQLGSKWFRKPSTWQSAGILGADITYFVGVLLVFLLLMVSICNHPLYKTVSFFTGQAQICKNFDAAVLTKTGMSSLLNASPGSFTCSGTRYCTNNWDGKIMQYSSQYGIDACILKTVIEKESAGNASAIGYDNDPKRGSFDISQPPKYNLDWNYSHGIGLTQWTIFPVQGGNQWVDGNTPSRNLAQIDIHPGQWYTVADFLNPDVSLSLTARRFAVDMTQSGGNLQQAFRSYNGSGPKADQYAVDSMRLYNICKGNGTVSP